MMKIPYKQKLSFYYLLIFAAFTIGITVFERSREIKFRTEALEERLDAYAGVIETAVGDTEQPKKRMDSLRFYLPENLRITLIDRKGKVLYDRAMEDESVLENHANRPEIIQALRDGKGSDIRVSASNNCEYLYYAKRSPYYFVRVALPYDIHLQHLLKADNLFLYYIIGLFLISLFFIRYVANRFGSSIKKLQDFSKNGGVGGEDFPHDELGDIGRKIEENYEQLSRDRKLIALEREKLLQHVHTSGEGLCFFTKDRTPNFYNGLFIQFLNIISDVSVSDPTAVFSEDSFRPVVDFLSEADKKNYYETQLLKQGRYFTIMVNVFEDESFEININDVTKQEKTRQLKQEMTANIAHELRTPVTSIRGYLEIVLDRTAEDDKNKDFLNKAYHQTLSLSELIQDMSLITKIEEAPDSFKRESISLEKVLTDLKNDVQDRLVEKNIHFDWSDMKDVLVRGNYNLLYSIFRNLTDNAIRYAGPNIDIFVMKYSEDKDFYYFSYSDTGVGISDESHLSRLFERFYRVGEGRTRDTGGSGLGLSIVRNAIAFHKGTVVVKNRAGGGLEFLFTLAK